MHAKFGVKRSAWGALGATLVISVSQAAGGDGNLAAAPGEAALLAYLRGSHQTKLSAQAANAAGDHYTLQYTTAPNPGVTDFREQPSVYSTVVTVSLEKNGAPLSSTSSTYFFRGNPLVMLGKTTSSGSPYAAIRGSYVLPATATVGDAGRFYEMTVYHDADMVTPEGFMSGTYAVSANNAASLLLCVNTTVSNVAEQGTADGLAAGAETDCYSIDAAGSAALASVTLPVGGETLTFK